MANAEFKTSEAKFTGLLWSRKPTSAGLILSAGASNKQDQHGWKRSFQASE
jgi:hypothetical protein